MSTTLAGLSDNLVHAATVVLALAMLGHAAAWAFTRERRSAARAAARGDRTGRQASGSEVVRTEATSGVGSTAVGAETGGRAGVAVMAPEGEGAAAAGGDPAAGGGLPAGGDPAAGDTPAGSGVLAATASRSPSGAAGASSAASRSPAGSGDVDRPAMFNRIGVALTILATLLLGFGVLTRGLAAGRVPWGNLYEFAITGSFVISIAYLVALRRLRLAFLGLPLTGFVLVILGIATTVLYLPVSGLIPALQSYWLVIHVSAAVFSTGIFTVGAVASVLQIVKARYERKTALGAGSGASGYLAQLPSSAVIERTAYRLHAFAFPIYTFAMIAGAVWAQAAWSRYWGWDPKETWMFITWVCYAAYLHARSTAGWRSKVSWIALVAYGALLFNLVGVNFVISGLHSYAM